VKSLSEVLTLTGNETFLGYDGEEAVTAAEKLRPNVILLDIGLPKLNGSDACRRLRENPWAKDILMIALTGWGKKTGVNPLKPVNVADLLNLLTRITVK
jgi:CheY-like chemotaxis protein